MKQPAAPTAAWPTLDHIYIAGLFTAVLLRVLTNPTPPEDFWWHLATGRLIASSGAIPLADSFSFTRAGEPFFNQSWLAQLLMYQLYQLGGMPLLIAAQAAVVGLTFWLVLRTCALRAPGRPRLVAVTLLLVGMLTFNNLIIRPQSYALPVFAAYALILTQHRLGGPGRLWLLPPLMAIWVNLHGSFVLGLALIALTAGALAIDALWPADHAARPRSLRAAAAPLAALARAQRGLLLWGALAALATLANPRGLEVIGYVRNLTGSSQVTTMVREWMPPTVREPLEALFFMSVISLLLAMAYAPRRPSRADLIVLLPFLWLALGAVRSVIWYVLLAAPLLALLLDGLLPRRAAPAPQGGRAVNLAIVAILAGLVLAASPWLRSSLRLPGLPGLISPNTPVAAVEALRADPRPPQRLFHEHGYGSYLIWAAPGQPVFIDPRIELYPREQIVDYQSLSNALNVDQLMQRYQIDGALLSHRVQPKLISALRADPRWEVRYEDPVAIYLVRRP